MEEEYEADLFKLEEKAVETMYLDFYSTTFQAMRTKYKKKYNLVLEDQVSYFFESLLLISMQVILCLGILTSGEVTVVWSYKFMPQVVQFFTNLAMHFGCIAIIRNGVQMMRFVIYHSDEFDNPQEVFILGILIILSNMLCEFTNMYSSLGYDKII